MDKSSLYLEIFGGDGLDEITHQKPVPAVPCLDDPLHDFRKSAGAADATMRQIETDALIDQLAPIPLEVLAERDAERFSPSPVPEPGLDFVKHVLGLGADRLQRRAEIAAGARQRSDDLRELAADSLSDLLPRNDPAQVADCNHWLDHFAESAEKVCSQVLLEVAAI